MRRRLTALFLYAAAMAFVESAVVVYLRALYPRRGFTAVSPLIYRIEVLREAATILMLLAVAYLAFETLTLRVATFFWIFAVWDVSYYVFLKLLLGWPASLGTYDVFFLIPVPWVGPVWLPLVLSLAVFIAASVAFTRLPSHARHEVASASN